MTAGRDPGLPTAGTDPTTLFSTLFSFLNDLFWVALTVSTYILKKKRLPTYDGNTSKVGKIDVNV